MSRIITDSPPDATDIVRDNQAIKDEPTLDPLPT
jgi:hypothetical protein